MCTLSHRPSAPNKLIDFMQTMGRSVGEKLPKTLLNDGSEFNCVSPIRNMHIPSRIMFHSTRLSQPNHAIRYEHSTNELHSFKGQKPETNHTHIRASGRASARAHLNPRFFFRSIDFPKSIWNRTTEKKKMQNERKKNNGKNFDCFIRIFDRHTHRLAATYRCINDKQSNGLFALCGHYMVQKPTYVPFIPSNMQNMMNEMPMNKLIKLCAKFDCKFARINK